MVIVRQKESNLLKYNVAADCLAIKLEGDLKSWTTYFEQIQFWSEIEIEFLPLSFPLPYNIEEKSLASTQHCTMQEGAGRYVFMVKDRKVPFWACSNIFCPSWTKYFEQVHFWGEIFLDPFFKAFSL